MSREKREAEAQAARSKERNNPEAPEMGTEIKIGRIGTGFIRQVHSLLTRIAKPDRESARAGRASQIQS